jgi:hypothetical protein
METLSPEVIADLRNGRAARERKIAVCATGAHLEPADRAEILTVMANDQDEGVAAKAQEALLSVPLESFVEAVKRATALPSLFRYVAHNLAEKPGICEAMIRNKNCGAEFLVRAVGQITTLGIQSLVEDLDRISQSPALISALAQSTSATAEQKNLFNELLSSSFDATAAAETLAEIEPDEAKRVTLLQRLAKMNVAARVQLAVKGGSEARRALIKDSSKVVQRAVLQSPRLTDQEVEMFASMSNLSDEILRLIANHRQFRKNYSVIRNLLSNAKTPLDASLHLLPMINSQDLKRLCLNKNIPETLRSTALKLSRQRREANK